MPTSRTISRGMVVVVVAVAVAAVLGAILILTPASSHAAPTIVSHTGIVTNSTPVVTSPIDASSGSLVLVFVSYINEEIGGGTIQEITDSLGDQYTLLTSTGGLLNHTESLYAAALTISDAALAVSVKISGGATPQGGSVAVVDVANANMSSVDGLGELTGLSGPATILFTAGHAGDLCLFGAAGRGFSGPYAPGPGMTLLDTGTADAGPFQDGVGYGTFSTTSQNTTVTMSATLNYPTYWEGIGIAIDP